MSRKVFLFKTFLAGSSFSEEKADVLTQLFIGLKFCIQERILLCLDVI